MAGENILFVLLDDMRDDFLPYLTSLSPLNLDATTFTNARAHTPVCAPSRLGFHTCQYANQNGTETGTGTASFDIDNSLYKWVSDQGYYVGHIGKYMNPYTTGIPAPLGVDYWRQFPDAAAYGNYDFGVHDGSTTTTITNTPQSTYIAEQFEAFVTAAGTDPWFCVLAPTDPHTPFEADGDALFGFDFMDYQLDLEEDVSDKPSWVQAQSQLTGEYQRLTKNYAKMQARELNRVDRLLLRRVIPQLDLTNTILIVSADNGLPYGEHRLWGAGVIKNDLYESSARIPFVMAGPGFSNTQVATSIAAHVDTARTICDITGATPGITPTGGLSLIDLVANGETGDWANRPVTLFRYGNEPGQGLHYNDNSGWAVVLGDWKMMRWEGFGATPISDPADEYELYDLANDPREHINLANDGAYASQLATMQQALADFLGE